MIGFTSYLTRLAAKRGSFDPFYRCRSALLHSARKNNNGKKGMEWKRNGTVELVIGGTILALLGADQFLQTRQTNERETIKDQLKLAIHVDQQSANLKSNGSSSLADKDNLALFQCTIRRKPKFFDGTRSLMNVEVGDVVDVLEESVGPEGMYNLCRTRRESGESKKSISQNEGWFPTTCLEKMNKM